MIDPKMFKMHHLVEGLLRNSRHDWPDWRNLATILPKYMPPHPRKDTRPICVVKLNDSFLRYSRGPRQGHLWDIYGDDYHTPELAFIALLEAPLPPGMINAETRKELNEFQETREDQAKVNQKLETFEEFKDIFKGAEFGEATFEEIPNEYCGPECCPHNVWYKVHTPAGTFKIGWRKRVISLDWSQTAIKTPSDFLFAHEETTKGEQMIHCWGYDKARHYLRMLKLNYNEVYGKTETVNHEAVSLALFKAIRESEYVDQLQPLMDHESNCELEPNFLGFMETYRALAELIPEGRTVIDLGCSSALQGFYFRNHAAYIGVDSFPNHLMFRVNNGRYYPMRIREFIARHPEEYLGKNTFAICNYVPMWQDTGTELLRFVFEHLYVFYPEHGDHPAEERRVAEITERYKKQRELEAQ